MANTKKTLTYLGYISTKGYIQLYVSRVSPRAASAALAFRLQQHLGHPLTLLAEGGN
jgi:hypothetical protein